MENADRGRELTFRCGCRRIFDTRGVFGTVDLVEPGCVGPHDSETVVLERLVNYDVTAEMLRQLFLHERDGNVARYYGGPLRR